MTKMQPFFEPKIYNNPAFGTFSYLLSLDYILFVNVFYVLKSKQKETFWMTDWVNPIVNMHLKCLYIRVGIKPVIQGEALSLSLSVISLL